MAATDCRINFLWNVGFGFAGICRDAIGGPQSHGARWTGIWSPRAKTSLLNQQSLEDCCLIVPTCKVKSHDLYKAWLAMVRPGGRESG